MKTGARKAVKGWSRSEEILSSAPALSSLVVHIRFHLQLKSRSHLDDLHHNVDKHESLKKEKNDRILIIARK